MIKTTWTARPNKGGYNTQCTKVSTSVGKKTRAIKEQMIESGFTDPNMVEWRPNNYKDDCSCVLKLISLFLDIFTKSCFFLNDTTSTTTKLAQKAPKIAQLCT